MYGAAPIAEFLDWPVRRVQHALANGLIPATRKGLVYTGSKRRLRRFFQGEAAEK